MVSILKSGLKILGSQQSQSQDSHGASTIEKLVERVESAITLDDRRDALRALKSLSKKFKYELGLCGLDVLINELHRDDNAFPELLGLAMDTLANIVSCEVEEDVDCSADDVKEMGERFTEHFIKKPHNVALVLALVEEKEFSVRWHAVRLLTNLLRSKLREVQEIILQNPGSIPPLVDLLEDTRDIIRNDALLLLSELTQSNANIQKIVAYESAFDRLFRIIEDEGDTIVVEDALYVMLNLLRNNPSNQQLFKENSLIPHLTPFMDFANSDSSVSNDIIWTPQKIANTLLLLQVVRTLVAPTNSAINLTSCQKAMKQCFLLKVLCDVLMATGITADILTESVNTVAEVIRGNKENQDYFASVVAPSEPPRLVMVVLLMSMINEKQQFPLRCAILYCIQCYLFKNEPGKIGIIQTLLPSQTDAAVDNTTTGLLLCRGLLGRDSVTVWLAAVALSHCIHESIGQKEQLLRVQLATSLGNPPVSLLQHCSQLLFQSNLSQVKIAILQLLCSWLAYCPSAVIHFLHNATNIPFLTAQVGSSEGEEMERHFQGLCAFLLGICYYFNDDSLEKSNRAALLKIIQQRVGLEVFAEKLESVSKSESYMRALQRPQQKARQPSELIFDHEFAKLLKTLEVDIVKSLGSSSSGSQQITNGIAAVSKMPHTVEQHENVVIQYKALIKEQDAELQKLRGSDKRNAELEAKNAELSQVIFELQARLKAADDDKFRAAALSSSAMGMGQFPTSADANVAYLEQQLREKCSLNEALSAKLDELQNNQSEKQMAESAKALIDHYQQEAATFRNYADQVREWAIAQSGANCDPNSLPNLLQAQIVELEKQLEFGWQAYESLRQQLDSTQAEKQNVQQALSEKDSACKATEAEYQSLKLEQEDLLVLLADQDQKLIEYKRIIRRLGGQLPQGDEEISDAEDTLR